MNTSDEHLGTAQCRGCKARTDVYITPFGARCEACKDMTPTHPECSECVDTDSIENRCERCMQYDPMEKKTFTPSLTTPSVDEHSIEMEENFEEFTDQLPDIGFDIELADGSTYEIDSYKSNAIILEHGDEWREFLEAVTRKVDEHYQKQTEPTKMVEYAPWGRSDHDETKSEYESQAELAPIVLYAYLRGALLQMSLAGMSGDEEEVATVIGISDTEITEYSMDGSVTVEHTTASDSVFFDEGDSQ